MAAYTNSTTRLVHTSTGRVYTWVASALNYASAASACRSSAPVGASSTLVVYNSHAEQMFVEDHFITVQRAAIAGYWIGLRHLNYTVANTSW
jgi:hypothetical protein